MCCSSERNKKSFRIKMPSINILDVKCYLKTEMNEGKKQIHMQMTFSDVKLADKLVSFLFSRLHSTYGHKVGTQSHYFSISFHFEVRLSVFPEGSNYKTFLLSTSDMCLMMVRADLCQPVQKHHE